jgi:hypothetical protein
MAVIDRGGPWGFKKSRIPHFLENRLRDNREIVSLMRWLPFISRNIPDTRFCYRLNRPQGHSAAGRIRSIEKFNDIGNGISVHPGLYRSASTN